MNPEIIKTEETKAASKPKNKRLSLLLWTLFILFSIGSVGYTILNDFVFNRMEVSSTIGEVLSQHWWYLLVAVAACAVFIISRSFVHAFMMHFFTGKFHFRLCLNVTILGIFYDDVTPLSTGGQPFQVSYLQKNKVSRETSLTLPIVEYSINRFVYVIMSVVAIILCAVNVFGANAITANTERTVVVALYTAASVGIALNLGLPLLLVISMFSMKACGAITRAIVKIAKFFRLTKDTDKLYSKIMSKLEMNMIYMKKLIKATELVFCFLLSFVSRLALLSISYFVLKAFGFSTVHGWGWAEIVILNILISNSVSFIPTPGNSGAADLSFYWVLNVAILNATGIVGAGSLATLCWRLISFYLPMLVGFIFVISSSSASRRNQRLLQRTST